jgi:lipopolysaccharide transport system permease protein
VDSSQATADDPVVVEPSALGILREAVSEVWHYRELLYFLVWRDLKIKYKQTALGVAWAILQPLLGMVVFTILFGRFAQLPTDGLPPPLFYYSGLLVWTYFASSIATASNSVVSNSSLITKVYFPRILLPGAAVLSGLVDLAIASTLLVGLMVWHAQPVGPALLLLPLAIAPLIVFAFATGLWLSALNVNFRDVRHAMPFAIQLWMFASPVVYPLSLVPESYRWLLALNPMTAMLEVTRALISGRAVEPWIVAVSAAVVTISLAASAVYFKRTERRFADII